MLVEDRSDVPIEPRISQQWFLRNERSAAVVRDHLIRSFRALGKSLRSVAGEHPRLGISRQVVGTPDGMKQTEIRNPKSEIYVGIEPSDPENWVHDPDT
jgi:valyl-tRNA synthetase